LLRKKRLVVAAAYLSWSDDYPWLSCEGEGLIRINEVVGMLINVKE
jgi:hypothetical protein